MPVAATPVEPETPPVPLTPQVQSEVGKIAENAEVEKSAAKMAYDKSRFDEALDHNQKCLDILTQGRDSQTNLQARAILDDFVRSESNRRILFCYTAVDESDLSEGISETWNSRITMLAPPQRLQDGSDLCQQDWTVNLAYASLQQHLADFAIRRDDYSEAGVRFATAETYFDLYEKEAPAEIVKNPETQTWRRKNRERLDQLISTHGIREGMYIQNSGILQKWIGKVQDIAGDAISVRITYLSSAAPRGLAVGEQSTFQRDEIKPIQGLSVDAILRGYR